MKKKKIVSLAVISLLSCALVAGDVVASIFSDFITKGLCGTGQDFDSEGFKEASAESDELCQKIAEDGIALLKNEKDVLPLSKGKVNVFGWSSIDNGFNLSGIGSGSSTIDENKKVSLLAALKDGGYETNDSLTDFYTAYDNKDRAYSTGDSSRTKMVEPKIGSYSDDLISDCKAFSDTAIVVISRVWGENVGEITQSQTYSDGETDKTRSYLELSQREEDLLDMVEANFGKVIVILNSSNQLQMPRLKNDVDIDAVLNAGLLGQSGTRAIPKILSGEVNPSGRLTDTWSNDYTIEPSFNNRERSGNNLAYVENCYFGYRFYETADQEGYFDDLGYEDLKGYDAAVTYPFGYGLSYTTFEWKLEDMNVTEGSQIEKTTHFKYTFSCTNTGKVAGKDVIQVYYSAPYYDGGIEKSAVNLADFAKTVELEPGKTQTDITLEFDSYDMASYDCYDQNENGFSGYELDPGEYTVSFRDTSHTLKEVKSIDGENIKNKINYTVGSSGVRFETDTTTGKEVTNLFTGEESYAGCPIDGSSIFKSGSGIKYFSRENHFGGGVPSAVNYNSGYNSSSVSAADKYIANEYTSDTMPVFNQDSGLLLKTNEDGSKINKADDLASGKFNYELIDKISENYDCDELQKLVEQMSVDEVTNLVENGGFKTASVLSIGKPQVNDFDGPAGFNNKTQVINDSLKGKWTAFPNETLIGQTFSKRMAKMMGMAVGKEGQQTGVQGWYAPGCNIHRSAFNGRNYEYYSEDPVLSGMMAANTVLGAKANGVYCYVKHFTLSEPGQNARQLNVWLTEQTYREIYLKPFEIAVKKGKANAMMSAFNGIGAVWAGACYAQNVSILREEWGFRGSVITDWTNGGADMDVVSGIFGGNDLWLNGAGNLSSHLNKNNASQMNAAQIACKNIIYTYCNTISYNKHYVPAEDENKANVGTVVTKKPFAWWIVVLAALNVVVFAGFGVWMFFLFRKKDEPVQK
mgnify:CR=1 FL=1